MIVLLVEDENYYDYNFIAWVGNDIKKDVNMLFGSESSRLGEAIRKSAINQENYKYALTQGIAQVIETMEDEVDKLNLESSFNCNEARSGVKSHITNLTSISISAATVDAALERFTESTGIPIAVVVDYQENVFGRSISAPDIFSLLIAIGLIVLTIVLIVKAVKSRKDQAPENGGGGDSRDYDQSKYNTKY